MDTLQVTQVPAQLNRRHHQMRHGKGMLKNSGQASLRFFAVGDRRFVLKAYASRQEYENEMAVLRALRNKTALVMQPTCTSRDRNEIVFPEARDGDLFHCDLRGRRYGDLVEIARQLVLAVDAVHRAGYLHMDVKPENVVLDGPEAYLIDFGLAHPVGAAPQGIGTPRMMAPEVLFRQLTSHPVTAQSDWWCVGATIFYMFARYFRLPPEAHFDYFPYRVLYCGDGVPAKLEWAVAPPHAFPRRLFNLLFGYAGLLHVRPADRPQTIHEVLGHSFFWPQSPLLA